MRSLESPRSPSSRTSMRSRVTPSSADDVWSMLSSAFLAASQPVPLPGMKSWRPPTARFRIWIPDRNRNNLLIDTTDLRWTVVCRLSAIAGGITGFVTEGAWSPHPAEPPRREGGHVLDTHLALPVGRAVIAELVGCLALVADRGNQALVGLAVNHWFYSVPGEAFGSSPDAEGGCALASDPDDDSPDGACLPALSAEVLQ